MTIYLWYAVHKGVSIPHAPIPSFSRAAALNQMVKVAARPGKVDIHWRTYDGASGQFTVEQQEARS